MNRHAAHTCALQHDDFLGALNLLDRVRQAPTWIHTEISLNMYKCSSYSTAANQGSVSLRDDCRGELCIQTIALLGQFERCDRIGRRGGDEP